MDRCHDLFQSLVDRLSRVGKPRLDAAQSWIAALIELGKGESGESLHARAQPMVVKPFAVRVHDHLGDVAHVPNFVRRAQPDFGKRIEPRAVVIRRRRRILQTDLAHPLPRTCVSAQFSPLRSWIRAECGQVSRVGITIPTPLPLRVGAKTRMCEGPQSRR